jgi:GntR family transcriptional regulator
MEDIKGGIEGGRYVTGDKIPSEIELSEMYTVSRITIRRAVEELVGEGYLTKRQGKGTYVNHRKLLRKLEQAGAVQSFTDACKNEGRTPGATLLQRRKVTPQPEERRFLNIGADDQLVYIQRVRTADGEPVMLENNLFPLDRFAFLLDEDLKDNSIFELIHERAGVLPTSTEKSTLEIVLASKDTAEPLGVSVGEPLFYENVHFLDASGGPLLIGQQYMVGTRYMFNL